MRRKVKHLPVVPPPDRWLGISLRRLARQLHHRARDSLVHDDGLPGRGVGHGALLGERGADVRGEGVVEVCKGE